MVSPAENQVATTSRRPDPRAVVVVVTLAAAMCPEVHQPRTPTPSSNPWSKRPLPNSSPLSASGPTLAQHSSSLLATTLSGPATRRPLLISMVYDPRTTEYINRRRMEALTKKEAVRCLKRYLARKVFSLLRHDKQGLTAHSEHRTEHHGGEAQPAITIRCP
jgi:hypothetical protein